MNSPFSFTLAAPTLKATDKASYEFALEKWKETVAWCAENYPGIIDGIRSSPPGGPSSTLPEKGYWERKYLDLHPEKRSVRFTTRFQEIYPDKEAFCQALCEGITEGEETEEKPLDLPDVEGLH